MEKIECKECKMKDRKIHALNSQLSDLKELVNIIKIKNSELHLVAKRLNYENIDLKKAIKLN